MAERDMDAPVERETMVDDSFGDKMPRRYQRRRPRQVVPDYVDWKDVEYLRQFIPERGKIMPRRRISGESLRRSSEPAPWRCCRL
jgi:ribosomal protein S18